jgi:hypothetical protein
MADTVIHPLAMVVAALHAVVALGKTLAISHSPWEIQLTIRQWLDRGGRYSLHVGHHFTRTLPIAVSMPSKNDR